MDLSSYLSRIGLPGLERRVDLATLCALHLAHATSIPFENLDILLGEGIRVDVPSIHEKLVTNRRGGYCFEQNTLLHAVLSELGFRPTILTARVRFLTTTLLARTHMLLLVELPEGPYLADVGFGGFGPTAPLALVEDRVQKLHLDTFRLRREGALWVLQGAMEGGFADLYAFTLEEQYPVDIELANHFTSTHPSSRFVTGLVATRPDVEAGCRHILRNAEYGTRRGDVVERRVLATGDELLDVLSSVFGLTFPAGTRFGRDRAEAPWPR